ncbi:MAG: ATP-binding cassette domain-containing protein [Litorimonas sp.]
MAEPPLLSIQSAALTFGGTPLLTDADLSVFGRDRVCLVGRNGSGKSTLMKIAAGLVEPDSGDIIRQPSANARYLEQSPDLSAFASVRDYVEAGLVGADDAARIPYLLDALGLSGREDPSNLSGGEMRRAALVRALAPEPDVLLLDEPTNHLDLPAIEWLEGELARSRSALVLISHDRRFLENLSRRVVWLDRGVTHELDKGFAHFEDWRDEMIEQEALDRHKLARKIHREEHWVTHGVSGRRKRNVRRLKELGTLKSQLKSATGPQGNVSVTVSEADKSAKRVVEMKDVYFAYPLEAGGERTIVDDLSLRIMRGERLALIGPNGSGKTTLLKLMTGGLDAQAGTIRLGENLEPLVIDQARAGLDPDMSLRDAMGDGSETVIVNGQPRHVMAYMKDFLFRPEQATTPLRALSGGERARVQLAKGLRLPSNLLILDEPTNDLDLETLDLLQEMVADYPGTVILVSHDRDFIDRLAARTLAYEGPGRWQLYPGGYSDMARQRGAGVEARGSTESKTRKKSAAPKKAKGRTEKLSYKETYRLETLPGEIDALGATITALNAELADPELYSRDAARFAQASEDLSEATEKLDAAELEWLELEEKRERLEG